MRYSLLLNLLCIALLTLATSSSLAGAPFVTDDPEPVEVHHLEVNYAFTKTWRNNASSASVPSVDLNYGLNSDIQLHAQPKYAYEREGEEKNYGLDNTEIGVKYRFINNKSNSSDFMVGIYPMLQLPTGDERLGGGRAKVQWFLPLWMQYNKDNWTLYGGTGYRVNNSIDSKNSWFFGGTALYQWTDNLKVGGELFRETATTIGENNTGGFNLGGIYDFNDDYHLLFSVGKGLSNVSSTNKLTVYWALQVIY